MLDVIQEKAVPSEELAYGRDREITKMLMINRVVLDVPNQLAHIGDFDHRDTIWLEQGRDPGDETVGVGDVCQHVVGMDNVGTTVTRDQTLGEVAAEEVFDRIHPTVTCRRNRRRRGVDAEHGNPCRTIVLEEVAIVARYLDH